MNKLQPDNFSITLRKDTFDIIKQGAVAKGSGLYRAIKDYLRVAVFPYMVHGDYIYIRGVEEHDETIGVTLHLNYRLLEKAMADDRRAV